MKVINFLPEDYQFRCSARRANIVCALLGVGAMALVGGAVALMAFQASGVTRARLAVDRQYEDAGRQIAQMKELEDRKAGLLHKVELSSSLLERVPRSTLLAHLTNALPPHTSLMSLTMNPVDVEEIAPPAAAPPGDRAPAPAAADAKKPPAKIKVKRLQFVLSGLAPTDVAVAEYIARLCADPVFQEIDLRFSEEFPYKETVRLRRFEIVLKLNPKAEDLLDRASAPKALTAAPSAAAPVVRGDS